MAILSVNEMHIGRENRIRTTVREYTRQYIVKTDVVDTKEPDILAHADMPKFGDGFSDDLKAKVRDIQVGPIDDERLIWVARIVYSTVVGRAGWNPGNDPPDRDPVVTWTHWSQMRLAMSAYVRPNNLGGVETRTPIQTSSAEVFPSAPEIEQFYPLVTIDRWIHLRDWDPNMLDLYINRLNNRNTTIMGKHVAAETALLTKWDGAEVFEEGEKYVQESLEVRILPDGWQFDPIDRGFCELKVDAGGGVKQTAITEGMLDPRLITGAVPADETKLSAQDQVNLSKQRIVTATNLLKGYASHKVDGDGDAVLDAHGERIPTPLIGWPLYFNVYPVVDFKKLGIG